MGTWKNIGGGISTATYGKYFLLHNHGCFLAFNPDLWSRLRCTPLWLSVKDPDWKPFSPATAAALAPLETGDPPRVIRQVPELVIPLYIPLGKEQAQVVEALVGQIRYVAELLARGESTGLTRTT